MQNVKISDWLGEYFISVWECFSLAKRTEVGSMCIKANQTEDNNRGKQMVRFPKTKCFSRFITPLIDAWWYIKSVLPWLPNKDDEIR